MRCSSSELKRRFFEGFYGLQENKQADTTQYHVSCSAEFDSVILWIVACHAPLSMEFFSQEYWNG